jgi:hypothetical protein
MDFDVGCRRDFSPLLKGDWDVVLAKTIPVRLSLFSLDLYCSCSMDW